MEIGDSDLTRATNRERAARQAEKDAETRIATAQRRALQTERDAEAQVARMKDEFIRTEARMSETNNEAVQNQRKKNYENLRDLKRAADSETLHVGMEGKQHVQEVSQQIQKSETDLKQDGDEKLRHLALDQNVEQEFIRNQHERIITELRSAQTQSMNQIRSEGEQSLEAGRKQALAETEMLTENQKVRTQATQERFENQYSQQIGDYKRTLDRLDQEAGSQLKRLQSDTSRKLNAYSDRSNDPFYRSMDLQTRVEETGEAYVIRAKVPPHERDHLSVTIQGNQLVLSGQRRNTERFESEAGHKSQTSSFQSYTETVPLPHPVDAKSLYREFDGDDFVVIVPKASIYGKPIAAQKPTPEGLHAARPVFPGNLPLAQEADEPPPSHGPGQPVRGKPGNTLS